MRKTIFVLFAIAAISCTPELKDVLPDAPAVPSQLTATSTSDTSVLFEWSAPEGGGR